MRYIPSTVTIAVTTLTLFAVSAALVLQSNAETIGSSYTSTAPKDCRVRSAGNGVDGSTIRVCPGRNGLIVLIAEDDLRETVSVGRNRLGASREPAAQTWFGPFNSTTHTVEWRSANGRPYAIIQRWHIADIDDEDKKTGRPIAKPMLAVTRLSPGPVCHVAYVDVQANPDANELARKAADEIARDFKCGTDKVKTVGNSGRAVELASR
ncbi:MAG: hypothetical protein GY844_33580 [Bradyrhizobium sp.]|nr:hypothetical protein [Bradyrhizobium sp.]